MSTRLTEAVKACIGREAVYTATEPIGEAAIRYFALAVGDDCPLYVDAAAAGRTRHGGMIAPPTLVCETNQIYPCTPGGDIYFGHRWDLPIDGDRTIRGGNEYVFHQPVRPDDRITVTWRIVDIQERETRQSGPLLFVTSEATYTNQRGELLAVNREVTIR